MKKKEEPAQAAEESIIDRTEKMDPEDDVNRMIRMAQLQNDILLRIKENLDQDNDE